MDTAGQDEFSAFREVYYRSGDGFILVCSFGDESSLREIRQFHSQVRRVREGKTMFLLSEILRLFSGFNHYHSLTTKISLFQVFIFVTKNSNKFDSLFFYKIKFQGQGDVPMVIAANKCDFEPGKRKFSEDAVVNLAQELGCRYFFTSALQDKNVDQVNLSHL